ncbi:multiple inositol polyphosphate phosphatase 1-like [Leptidea sinapis]|uniref:multiple inositol polyphosphate phosphatase 1-like n=1 Tax=Leptidea sinapis TaxID=189913 RepID=UPI0021C2A47F|nr:multiple inositol polyphosphate phosphatase 1-like [Leptidea sinapis]
MYATKTPYDSIRGDIRDFPSIPNCEVRSVWALIRHGNRNPSGTVTGEMNELQAKIKHEIIASYEAGNNSLCAQDIQDLRAWTWNSTMDVSESYLTGTGYEEIYDMAKRIREKYPHLLAGTEEHFYFRPTYKQRTVASAMAFVHGLTEGTNLNLTADEPLERDDMLRPYDNCDRYQEDVKGGQPLADELEAFWRTEEYVAMQQGVQKRLGIPTQLTAAEVYTLHELCRFYRSWSPTLRSPWCAAFTNEDLVVIEYRDDVRHFQRNGYASTINAKLGHFVLRDMYENFAASVQGEGRNLVSYFAHDTLMEMTFCALGLFRDPEGIAAAVRNPNRQWRTSLIAPFSTNIMAVLNRCETANDVSHRVQFFINEKLTSLCPLEGCSWEQFSSIFTPFTDTTLEFCRRDYRQPDEPVTGSSVAISGSMILFAALTIVRYLM